MENNLDNATNEFGNVNDNVDKPLNAMEEEFTQGETPENFDNECHGMMTVKQMKEEKVDDLMFFASVI